MYKALAILALALPVPALRADPITFGVIRVDADSPSLGLSAFVVTNVTGPGACDSYFNVCTALTVNNGLLRIDYESAGTPGFATAVLPDGFGPGETDPALFPDFNFDLSGWTVQNVTFSGSLSPAAIVTFDGTPLAIQPLSFSVSFDPGVTSFAELTGTAAIPVVTVPEGAALPGSLLLGGLAAAAASGMRRRQR